MENIANLKKQIVLSFLTDSSNLEYLFLAFIEVVDSIEDDNDLGSTIRDLTDNIRILVK